jgi:hypothetical protein
VTTTLADVLRHFGDRYLQAHGLSRQQACAWRAIVACASPALGGQRLRCGNCGAEQWRWHSCRNRHCPRCQSRQRDAWRAARLAELLDVPYCHLVFTLPHQINPLASMHPRWVYDTLMRSAAETLTAFAADPRWLGGVGAFTLVLHTWTQDLRRHIHVHALMACGAVRFDVGRGGIGAVNGSVADASVVGAVAGDRCSNHAEIDRGEVAWVAPTRSPTFLFPVHALSRVFRGKFMQALQDAETAATLPRDPAANSAARRQRAQALRRYDWVVYAKTPLAGPAAVLDYLSRYTHRTAISDERIVGIDAQQVRLRVRADGQGGKKTIALDGVEFIGRFLQHVLPSGFKRIRHYGLLAPAAKNRRMAIARNLLAMPQPNPVACEQAADFMRRVAAIDIERCPHCQRGHWLVVEQRNADRELLARIGPHACRGPP